LIVKRALLSATIRHKGVLTVALWRSGVAEDAP